MPAGRPRTIASPEEFEARAEEYFREAAETNTPLTVTGLALAVGLSSRESLQEYARREEYSDPVKRAKLRVEHAYECRLMGHSPAGAIFGLKNFGWSDKLAIEQAEPVTIVIQKNWE